MGVLSNMDSSMQLSFGRVNSFILNSYEQRPYS